MKRVAVAKLELKKREEVESKTYREELLQELQIVQEQSVWGEAKANQRKKHAGCRLPVHCLWNCSFDLCNCNLCQNLPKYKF